MPSEMEMTSKDVKTVRLHRSGGSRSVVLPKAWLADLGLLSEVAQVDLLLLDEGILLRPTPHALDAPTLNFTDTLLDARLDGCSLLLLANHNLADSGSDRDSNRYRHLAMLSAECLQSISNGHLGDTYEGVIRYLWSEIFARAENNAHTTSHLLMLVHWAAQGIVARSLNAHAAELTEPLKEAIGAAWPESSWVRVPGGQGAPPVMNTRGP